MYKLSHIIKDDPGNCLTAFSPTWEETIEKLAHNLSTGTLNEVPNQKKKIPACARQTKCRTLKKNYSRMSFPVTNDNNNDKAKNKSSITTQSCWRETWDKKTAINIIRLREVTFTICMLPTNIFTFTNNFSIKFQFPDISTESCPQDGTNISRNNNEMLAFLDRYYLLSKL
jgi:hypothetical protein